MPWKERDRMSLREEFILLNQNQFLSVTDLCKRFEISRKTAYKWMSRHTLKGVSGLVDLSRSPENIPHKTSKVLEKAVVELRLKYPTWGGRKIKQKLLDQGYIKVPAASTITDILHRAQLIDLNHKNTPSFIRFEREAPNDLWQMDFKGYFKLRNGSRCDPLTLLDDHSRYNLCLKACKTQDRESVQESLEEVFKRYGLPWQMTMDNGGPWGGHALGEYTKLSVWLMKLGIKVSHSRPYHPQTQGKLERFHRTLKADVLQFKTFENYESCQDHFNEFRKIYNQERPHEALNYESPSKRYQISTRAYPNKIPEPEYDSNDLVLKVRSQGSIEYKNKSYFIGRAFKGEYVAIKKSLEKGIKVYFGSYKIKEFN